MPYVLKPNKIFVKNQNGSGYLPQNVVSDKATSDALAEIAQATAQSVTSINTAKDEALSIIPDEYEELQAAVNNTVRVTSQSLSENQKSQARMNLGLNFMEGDQGWGPEKQNIARRTLNVANLAPNYNPKMSYPLNYYVAYQGDYYYCSTPTSGTESSPEEFDWDKWTYIPANPQNISYGRTQTLSIDEQKVALNNIGAPFLGIRPEQFGAVGDGIADDYNPIQYCLNMAANLGTSVSFSAGKTYAISSGWPILRRRVDVYGNGATIKSINADAVYCLEIDSSEGQFPGVTGKGLIENLTLDCNGKAKTGIYVTAAQGFQFQNIDVRTPSESGMYVKSSFEIMVMSFRVAGADEYNKAVRYSSGARVMHSGHLVECNGDTTGAYDSSKWDDLGAISVTDTIGIDVNCNDSHFTDIVTKNVGTAIRVNGPSNFFTRVHSWNTCPSIIPTSKMFDANYGFISSDCYCDTCAVTVKVHNKIFVEMFGMMILHGGSGADGYMQPSIMGSVVPAVFELSNAVHADGIRSFGMMYLSASETYNLFSIDIGDHGSNFDWDKMNDESIRSMGHFPLTPTDILSAKLATFESRISALEG